MDGRSTVEGGRRRPGPGFLSRIAVATASSMLALAALACGPAVAAAPVRFIVPYVPGGATDTVARLVAPFIAEELGAPVVVENHAGASGTVGLQLVARAKPDGTTIGMTDSAFVVNPALLKVAPYDAQKDFVPVSLVDTSALVLMVNPTVPAGSVKELVALAKAKPGTLTFASAGSGTAIHIAGEELRLAAGIDLLHVSYRGLGPAMVDVMGGQVSMVFGGPHTARQQVAAGKLRALAITGAARSKAMPDVVSFAEAGYPQVDMVTANGIVAPAGMSPETVRRINAAVQRALESPGVRSQFETLGLDAVGGPPERFRDWIAEQLPKWRTLVRDAQIQVD